MTVQQSLTEQDKAFLISVNRLEPDWQVYDFERFPAVQWKLQNLKTLQQNNLQKYTAQCEALNVVLMEKH